jgi:hypothetical protein
MQCGVGRISVVVALSLALGLAGVSASARSSQEKIVIRIGALVDQTGPSTSPLFTKAVELAALQMNQALNHRGVRVEFEVLFGDTKSNATIARTEALRLINDEQVVGLLTASSGETVGVNKYNYDPATPTLAKVPLTCFQCSSGQLALPGLLQFQLRSRRPQPGHREHRRWRHQWRWRSQGRDTR